MNTNYASTLPVITASAFETEVVAASQTHPVVVEFGADWCGPCRALAPALNALATESDLGASIVTVDADNEPGLASRFGIRALPTLLFFHRGKVADQIVGLTSPATIREHIAAVAHH
jgi:thioredoxin 1